MAFPEITLAPGRNRSGFRFGQGAFRRSGRTPRALRINRSSDVLYLSSPSGVLVDQVEINGLAADAALLRDSDEAWAVGAPSPGQPNTDEGAAAYTAALDAKRPSPVRITEVMSRNTKFGAVDRSDWVELQNVSDEPVSLNGLFLSNDPELPGLFPLPDITLPADGRVVFYCNEADLPNARNRQTNFRLNGDGAVYYTMRVKNCSTAYAIPDLP